MVVFLSTIADTGMGTAAHRVAGDKRCVTINLDMKFISAGQLGDKLKGDVKILKKTKTLVFISCEISNDKEIVVSAGLELGKNFFQQSFWTKLIFVSVEPFSVQN